MTSVRSMTPAARKNLIYTIVEEELIDSQESLVQALKRRGVVVTQATASRDLLELGALRGRDSRGVVRYLVPTLPTAKATEALLLSFETSGNIAVLKTPPGGAQLLASALDHSDISSLIGTIAGDDTVLAISKSAQGANALVKQIEAFLAGSAIKSANNKQKQKRK